MLESLLDFIFPKRCVGCKKFGEYLCSSCFAKISFAQKYFCGVCGHASYNGLTHPKCEGKYSIDGIFPILNYHGLLKKILYQYKYNPHLSDLTRVLGDFLYEGFIQNETLMKDMQKGECAFISVPLHEKRQKTRGYNQSELLAEYVSKKLGSKYLKDILVRKKNTTPQFKLPKSERHENIKGAFAILKREHIRGCTVFLVDDITTTGATLLECANVLKRNGVQKVYGVALGHEEK